MRIGFDARFLTHPQAGGFKTYSQELVRALARVDSANDYLLYVDREPERGQKIWTELAGHSNFHVTVLPGAIPMVGMIWREQVALAWRASRDRVDLLHCPALTAPICFSRPLVVTLHDMIWRFPEKYSRSNGSKLTKRRLVEWYYREMPARAALRAKAIITLSHASRARILENLPVRAERVNVTHAAASPRFKRIEDRRAIMEFLQKRDLPEDYVLAIGSADPRKNLTSLLHAFAKLPPGLRNRHALVIIWTHDRLAEDMTALSRRLKIDDQVRFLTGVSDRGLRLLYSGASLFVFPSLQEGFGLPPLEAMACGTPVVAADNSSIPEITGKAAILFDERDPGSIAGAVQRVLCDPTLQSWMCEAGLERAARFSWERCARETLAVYRNVVGA